MRSKHECNTFEIIREGEQINTRYGFTNIATPPTQEEIYGLKTWQQSGVNSRSNMSAESQVSVTKTD